MSTINFRVDKHTIPAQHVREYPRATINGGDDELKIVIKQYTPHDNPDPKPGDVTLIAAHANGVVKELYEPLWDELYMLSRNKGTFKIRSIWIADVAHQGFSSVVNEDKLGVDPSWYDHPRDLLHMVNHFRKQMIRPIFGVGHSMGGNNVINVSLMHPRLLTGLILLDPVAQREPSTMGNYSPAYMSTFRRDVWPSREEAASSFRKNAFYQQWDPRCLDMQIKYGLRDLPTALHQTCTPRSGSPSSKSDSKSFDTAPETPVTLTATKHQEVLTFMRPNFPKSFGEQALKDHVPDLRKVPDIVPSSSGSAPFYRPEPMSTFINLPHLRPRCLYIFAKDSPLSAPDQIEHKMKATGIGHGGNGGKDVENAVQMIVIEKAGHFFPFEKPKAVAEESFRWLGEEMERWKSQAQLEEKEWAQVKMKDGGKGRFTLSDEYVQWIKFDREMRLKPDPAESKKKNESSGGTKL